MGGPYDRKSPRPEAAVQSKLLQLGNITERFIVAPTATLNRWGYSMEVEQSRWVSYHSLP